MTFFVKRKKRHHRVVFLKGAVTDPQHSTSPTSALNRLLYKKDRLANPRYRPHPSIDFQYTSSTATTATMAETARASIAPDLFSQPPLIQDILKTQTSIIQDATIQECLPYFTGSMDCFTYNDHGVPHLDRKRHIQFLHKSLRKLPAGFVTADASRPWMFYWALAGLSAMGEDISEYQEKIISTCRPIQNASGGFGGGNGQASHLAPTYAIILSIAMVGGTEALELIDRKAMWKWLGLLKQPEGGFQMSVGGEVDVR
jgi:protein farnesyltransferase subunit beta